VVLATALRATEGLDLAGMGAGSSEATHVVAEALQHAYADRARFLGDPDFVDVPLDRLLSDARVAEVATAIDPTRTWPAERYGLPFDAAEDAGTQHVAVIDADGGAVALTSTINTGFGSGVVVRSLGLVLNNQMDDFAVAPGVPNAYGLVGSARNAIAPGKRPLSSMTPTLVYGADGAVEMAVGASGGAQIPSSVAQVVLDVVVFGLDAQEAVAAPRFHHQWQPHRLVVEPGVPADVRRALEARGHELRVDDLYSSVQIAVRTGDGAVQGGSDPRKGGWPAAVRR
jgi:gamma-glutamyltranspeptidase/glutathione hydrolase